MILKGKNMINFELCELHLKKRVKEIPYIWSGYQNNEKDKLTSKIYKIKSYGELIKTFSNYSSDIKNYAYNRWLNYWSAYATEHFFVNNNYVNVEKEKNKYNKEVDFYILNTPFDHKTTKLPKIFFNRINDLNDEQFKIELINWLYENQSKEQRKHYGNRIFVVLVDRKKIKDSWKIKAELSLIKEKINEYFYNFNLKKEYVKIVINDKVILSDVIFIVK